MNIAKYQTGEHFATP